MGADLNITQHPSLNFGPRKHGRGPDMIVIHYTAMDSAEEAIERLCSPEHEVSAHYVIAENGEITQLVDEDMRAWHAGAGAWGDVTDVNSHSIGIELDYCPPFEGRKEFDERQMVALEALLKGILKRRSEITIDGVIGHSDMAPGRKFDPGPDFPWQRLARNGLAIWPSDMVEHQPDWAGFKSAATAFGYRPPTDDTDGWNAVLFAFRSRFLAGHVGRLDAQDMSMIMRLAKIAQDRDKSA